jgi:hypothetical protein
MYFFKKKHKFKIIITRDLKIFKNNKKKIESNLVLIEFITRNMILNK